ncbi:MAG: methylmalonyl Co-A mutase-associated GTPase MeaB [Acidimicrobiia bacterium]|nr:MAG: methylmalonyl Co-A mutase-associated GTPase MeaB [Acidimicrobiia bacterium]
MELNELLDKALGSDTRSIGRLLTSIENRTPLGREALARLYAGGGTSRSVGVTGTAGAGKSTLTSSLLTRMLDQGGKIAVVAVDPSSPFTGGAILGDRVRMTEHASEDRVFIRSVANRGSLGGISETTPAIVAALDGLGFPEVVIETVGIGQSEVEIATTADTTVVVVSPGWGDAVQVSKAGFLEIADIFVVNKSDRDGASRAVADLRAMIELGPTTSWTPPVLETVATTGAGVDELWAAVLAHRAHLDSTGAMAQRRRLRAAAQFSAAVRQAVGETVAPEDDSLDLIGAIADRSIDPWTAADQALTRN